MIADGWMQQPQQMPQLQQNLSSVSLGHSIMLQTQQPLQSVERREFNLFDAVILNDHHDNANILENSIIYKKEIIGIITIDTVYTKLLYLSGTWIKNIN